MLQRFHLLHKLIFDAAGKNIDKVFEDNGGGFIRSLVTYIPLFVTYLARDKLARIADIKYELVSLYQVCTFKMEECHAAA